MVIAVLIVAVFALLAGLRVSALVGHDGAVHYASPGVRKASADCKRLEHRLHFHR